MRFEQSVALFGLVVAVFAVVISTILGLTIAKAPWWVTVILLIPACTILWASIAIVSPNRLLRMVDNLRGDDWRPLYRASATRLADFGLSLFGGARPDGDERTLWATLRDTLTYRLLDRALLFAVAYPILLLVVFWSLTLQPAKLGDVVVAPPADAAWKHTATLGGIALIVLGFHLDGRWAASPQRFLRSVAGWLGLCFSLLFAAVAVAVAFAGAFAVAVAVAVAFAVAVAVAVDYLLKRDRGLAAGALALAYPALMVGAALLLIDWEQVNDFGRTTFLFLAVLPWVNAIFDTVSYWVTLALMQSGLRGGAFMWALADAVVAGLLFLALGAALVAVTSAMEAVSGLDFIDLGGLLAQAGDVGQYWWLYAMLFSTALPTFLHFCVACFSLSAFVKEGWRNWLIHEINEAAEGDVGSAVIAAFGVGMLWAASLLLPLGLIGGAVYVLRDWVLVGLGAYRDWLLSVAVWAGGI